MALNSVPSIALSGMQSAMQRLGSASHNIANASTAGFQRELASNTSQAGGGVATNITTSITSSTGFGDGLAEDVIAQRVALYEFKSNMQVFKTQQEMMGTLLDLRA